VRTTSTFNAHFSPHCSLSGPGGDSDSALFDEIAAYATSSWAYLEASLRIFARSFESPSTSPRDRLLRMLTLLRLTLSTDTAWPADESTEALVGKVGGLSKGFERGASSPCGLKAPD
jgi:hypothetical protein